MKTGYKILIIMAAFILLQPHAHAQKSALLWGTYFGGDTTAYGNGNAATDALGNVYMIGTSFSNTGLATQGAYQTLGNTNGDAILAKFSPTGKLLWATYFGGGNDGADGRGVAIDKNNNIYITGATGNNSDIATSGAYQTFLNGTLDAYIAKFSSSGNLLWATYYGGNEETPSYDIATDTTGNVYLTGETNSTSGIATSGAFQTSFKGDSIYWNPFLAKFNSSGKLIWSTYFNVNMFYGEMCLATDIFNNVYFTGTTNSKSGVATTGAYQTSYGGDTDAFLAKFSPSGRLVWATYFGGPGQDDGRGVRTDKNSNVYLTGSTASRTNIASSGAYQTSYSGDTDIFLVKFNSSGALIWSTYFGGNDIDDATYIATDSHCNIYITGTTGSLEGIVTSGAYQTSCDTVNGDAFLAKFNNKGNLLSGTYFGGDGGTVGTYLTSDFQNNIYIYGFVDGPYDFPYPSSGLATSGAYQSSGYYEEAIFLGKFNIHTYDNDAGISLIPFLNRTSCTDTIPVIVQLKNYGIDTLKSVKIRYTINNDTQAIYNWSGSLLSGGVIPVVVGTYDFIPGAYSVIAWTSLPNGENDSFPANDTATLINTVNALPTATNGPNQSICEGGSANIGNAFTPGNTYIWKSKPVGFSSTVPYPTVSPSITTTYILTESTPGGGCKKSDTVIITVKPLPAIPTIKKDKDTLMSSATSGNQWLETGKVIKGATNQKYIPTASGNYSVLVTDSDGCSSTSASFAFTGINEIRDNLSLIIYPNPSQSIFNIEIPGENIGETEISIADIFGRQVGRFVVHGKNEFVINTVVYNMKRGVYILYIRSGGNVVEGKLVVE